MLLPPSLLALLLLLAPSASHITRVVYKVPEEQPPNTLIGSLAADYGLPDVGHLYKLEVGAPYLRVDGKTGDIFTTETSIDREGLRECQNQIPGNPCILEFEVSITDLVQNGSPRLIEGQIEVQDINDNTPNFASPVITLAIPENTNIGSLFPIPLATDRDAGTNGVASYELQAGPEAQELFGLQVAEDQEEKQPQLIVMGNLDRERWDSYDLTIKVQDGGSPPRASSALLRVTVLDTNDNAPKFERPTYEAELSENSPIGHSVIQVRGPLHLTRQGETSLEMGSAKSRWEVPLLREITECGRACLSFPPTPAKAEFLTCFLSSTSKSGTFFHCQATKMTATEHLSSLITSPSVST